MNTVASVDLDNRTITHIMTTRVVSVEMDQTLGDVQDLFARHSFHHLLVVEQGKLVGMISDRDLLKAVSPYIGTLSETSRDLATLSKRVHQVMTSQIVTVTVTTTLREAAELMMKSGISCLPVVTADNSLLGLITWKDILKGVCGFVP